MWPVLMLPAIQNMISLKLLFGLQIDLNMSQNIVYGDSFNMLSTDWCPLESVTYVIMWSQKPQATFVC